MRQASVLTLVSFNEHGVILEAFDLADESHWTANEVHDLLDAYEGVWFSVHCFNFLCHFSLAVIVFIIINF